MINSTKMNSEPLFSVVVIARNEAKTLPRLVESLKEFRDRGGEIVVVDTGSIDGTQEAALQLGCKVIHKGSDFVHRLGAEEADEINEHFLVGDEPKIVQADIKLFDYAEARNCAAQYASNEVVAMPDCDEIYTALDIDKINEVIRSGVQQLEYDFTFSHDEQGRPLIQFMHCKFYDRRALKWQGIIHEVLVGDAKKQYLPPEVIKLDHYQNPETSRGHYLTGLALDCYQHPENDRNSHYFARELMWSGRPKSALKEFGRHILMDKWPAEKAQSFIYCGEIRESLGQAAALDCYTAAALTDGTRRAAFIRLAQHFFRLGRPFETRTWASAALTIPLNSYYGNDMSDYRHVPHEMLYWAEWQLGDKARSEEHWRKCLEYEPRNTKFLSAAQFYIELPKVSIIVPHIEGTRARELELLQELIKKNANYPNYEVHVELDFLMNRYGVAKTFNRGVDCTDGELVMFLGDDCRPQPNFLIEAVLFLIRQEPVNKTHGWESDSYYRTGAGLLALNDGLWDGKLATHWLAHRKFKDFLPDNKFLHEGYNHVGCDNELTARAKQIHRFNYAPHSIIVHKPIDDGVRKVAWDPEAVEEDRELLHARAKIYGFEVI